MITALRIPLAASTALVLLVAGAGAQESRPLPTLLSDPATRSAVPVPPSERALPTVVAEPWFRVSEAPMELEGPAFDRFGNLLFSDVHGGRVLRLTPERQLSAVVSEPGLSPGGLALHVDGRIFVASSGAGQGGAVVAFRPDGAGREVIIGPERGFVPNDLVFDAAGGFYLTDFRGLSTEPRGGVFHVSSDGRSVTPILPHLALANGVALSPDGRTLWVTEFGRNLLHRVMLTGTTEIAPFGTTVAYHFTGPAPDSMRVDAAGNLYVALYGQGRVLVLNPRGLPVGQILLPGRDEGESLNLTSMALRPGTNELFIVANDPRPGGRGAGIFRAGALAAALPLPTQR